MKYLYRVTQCFHYRLVLPNSQVSTNFFFSKSPFLFLMLLDMDLRTIKFAIVKKFLKKCISISYERMHGKIHFLWRRRIKFLFRGKVVFHFYRKLSSIVAVKWLSNFWRFHPSPEKLLCPYKLFKIKLLR